MKFKNIIMPALVFGLGLGAASCGESNDSFLDKKINLYTRDTTSGTREGFFEKIGYKEGVKDDIKLKGATIVSGNGDMIQKVANDEYAIGYISLSTLGENNKVKGLTFEGVEPTEANVINESYKLTRNFNYMTRKAGDFGDTKKEELVNAFIAYMGTKEGKSIIKQGHGILALTGEEKSWNDIKDDFPIVNDATANITVKVGGSTSVEEIARSLTSSFVGTCASKNIKFEHNHKGSGDSYKNTQGTEKDNNSSKLDIGFLSREIEVSGSEPAAKGTYGKICTDAIVAVVNTQNVDFNETTANQLKDIYSVDGKASIWGDVIETK